MNEADGEWLTAPEVVARYKLRSLGALYAMRTRGKGPRGHRFGRELRFREDDLRAWEAQRAERTRVRA
ncbi:helix-turn-helix transcriptional regulator [Actinomadura sp. 21ATH]|uniref:helix-turn-helix transcriptional regulator n=1 Tax=Actinomadura sp. 21ATH TaxID=1735444 RepID=UPI0035C01DA0